MENAKEDNYDYKKVTKQNKLTQKVSEQFKVKAKN